MNRPMRPRLARPARLLALSLLVSCLLAIPVETNAAGPPIIPAKGLVAYVESDGLDAHADAWKATAAAAVFEQTPAGAMVADVARQVVDHLLKGKEDPKPSGADLVALQESIVRRGFALGVYDDSSMVVVLKGLGREDARARTERIAGFVAGDAIHRGGLLKRGRYIRVVYKQVPGADVPCIGNALAWWFEGDDLIAAYGPPGAKGTLAGPLLEDAVLDTIAGEASSVAIHPGRAAALAEGDEIKGFVPAGLFFIEGNSLQGLVARTTKAVAAANAPLEPLPLPSGKYLHDDVQYFAPGTDFPWANTQAATQRARMQAKEIEIPALPFADPRPIPPAKDGEVLPATDMGLDDPVLSLPAPMKDGELSPAASVPAPGAGASASKSKQKPEKKPFDPIKHLGLDGVTRIVGRWGFEGKALLTDVRIEAPAPRKGILAMLDQPGFRKDRLPALPAGTKNFLVGSLDPVKAYDDVAAAADRAEPTGSVLDGGFADDIDIAVYMLTRQRMREDLLGHFGPTWTLYEDRDKGGDTPLPTLLVDLDDARGFGKVLDALAKRANAQLKPSKEVEDDTPMMVLKPLEAPDRGYRLAVSAEVVGLLGAGLEPTILLGRSHAALAADPTKARAALAAAEGEGDDEHAAGVPAEALACLPDRLTSLSVADPAGSAWPATLAALPKLVQFLIHGAEVFEGDPARATIGKEVLGLVLGVPRRGGFRLRLDPARVPKPEAIEAQLFPSVLATAVDDRGLRLIGREALPFACTAPTFHFEGSTKAGEALTFKFPLFLDPSASLKFAVDRKEEGGKFRASFSWERVPGE